MSESLLTNDHCSPTTAPVRVLVVDDSPFVCRLLAAQLDKYTQIEVREAIAGEPLQLGVALVAPGDGT